MSGNASWINRVSAAALPRFEEVMGWLGLAGGKRQGREYLPLNPKRGDEHHGSFSINMDSGAWMEGATGDKGGDLVALVAYLHGCRQIEAADRLGAFLGLVKPESRQEAGKGPGRRGQGTPTPTTAAPRLATATPASRESGSSKAGKVGQCLIPVPDGAPPPPATHARHGKPVARWAYRDAAGRVCFYHDRYQPPGERKQFAPLTLWRTPDGRLTWQFKAPPPPRPCFNGDQLAARPAAPVVVVEGEKAADAAAQLLPGHVVVCWQGGAQAVERTDWAPLAGRDVLLWPDADEPGAVCMGKLAKILGQVGAASIRQVELAALAVTPGTDEAGTPTLTPGDPLADGDDAADLLARDWTAAHLAKALETSGALVTIPQEHPKGGGGTATVGAVAGQAAAAPIAASQRGFMVDAKGVYYLEPEKAPRWVCPPLHVVALVRDPNGEGWGKLVEFQDPDGSDKQRIIPDAMLSGDGTELERTLRGAGLKVAPTGRPLLRQYLIEASPKGRARVTDRTGWHDAKEGAAVFVLPAQSFGQGAEEWIFQTDAPGASTFRQRGTLQGWQGEVAARCVGNSRLVFSVCMAFAAPLLHVTGGESGGFHFKSGSSDGKTTALRVGASVCGGADYMQRWRATDNGLEGMALQHCDAALYLDELAQLAPQAAGEVAYMLANGAGKARAARTGGMREQARWRLLFLSAGEIGLAQHMGEAGKQAKAGQELRLAEIPADAGAGLGVFECLHDAANGSEFAKSLDRAIARHHGTAWPAFLERLASERDGLADTLHAGVKAFEARFLTDQAAGQARRVSSRFALVGAAGELATEWGITSWAPGEAMKAAGACFGAWVKNRGGEGNHEERAMLAQVREFLQRYAESAFSDWDRPGVDTSTHASVRSDRAGYRRHKGDADHGEVEFFIFNEVWRSRVCKGLDPAAVGRLMLARGYVKKGEREWVGKVRTPEGLSRVVHVLPAFLESED